MFFYLLILQTYTAYSCGISFQVLSDAGQKASRSAAAQTDSAGRKQRTVTQVDSEI